MTTKTKTEFPLRMIDPAIIFLNPSNPRPDLGDLSELTASIKAHGVIQPILVRPVDGGYMVVAGSRRLAVALRLSLSSIPCQVKDLDDDTAFEIATAENVIRKDMSIIAEIRAVETLTLTGESHAEIAARFGRTPKWVSTRAKIAQMPGEVLDLVSSGELGLALAEELCKTSDKEEQVRLAKWAVGAEASLSEMRNQVGYCLRDLADAPWDAKDCSKCILRSDKQCNLFGDADGPARCMDVHCWEDKLAKFCARKDKELRAAGHMPAQSWMGEYNFRQSLGSILDETRDAERIAELMEAGIKPRFMVSSDGEVLLRYDLDDMPEKVEKTASGDDAPEAEDDANADEPQAADPEQVEEAEPEESEESSEPSEWELKREAKRREYEKTKRIKDIAIERLRVDDIEWDRLLPFIAEIIRANTSSKLDTLYEQTNDNRKAQELPEINGLEQMKPSDVAEYLLVTIFDEIDTSEGIKKLTAACGLAWDGLESSVEFEMQESKA